MKRTFYNVLFGIFLLSFSTASCQPPERQENIRQRIQTIKVLRLTEILELTEEQSIRFFPRYKEYEESLIKLEEEQNLVLDEMELRAANTTDTTELKKVIERYKEIEKEKLKLRTGLAEKFADLLSQTQIARLIIFEYRFPQRMRELIEEYHGEMRGKPGPHPGPKGPRWWDD